MSDTFKLPRRSFLGTAAIGLAAAQLAATANGLSIHPLQQALQEYPEQDQPRAQIHRLLGARQPGGTVQMGGRLGYGPAVGPAPRRGVQAHLLHA